MTLVEVTVVMVLATLVVMGLISFYASSQALWMRGSSQALAQRDATLLIEALSDSVRQYAHAEVFDSPDALHQGVILYDSDRNERCRFWWDENDARVHFGPGLGDDRGPVVSSLVARFELDTLERVVQVRLLSVRSAEGDLVRMTSAAALLNRGTPP
jgi:hypothetical protein